VVAEDKRCGTPPSCSCRREDRNQSGSAPGAAASRNKMSPIVTDTPVDARDSTYPISLSSFDDGTVPIRSHPCLNLTCAFEPSPG
jgi:hypothetical protein